MCTDPSEYDVPQGKAVRLEVDMDKIKTAAYCRVSTNSDKQDGSFEVQCAYYENLIKKNSVCRREKE